MTDSITVYHVPALLRESIEALNIKANGIYVDATYGGGGHSREILSRLKDGKLVAFDRDTDAEKNLPEDRRLIFVKNNFRFMRNFLRYYGIGKVDGILADLGVSSHHFDDSERGFSFRFPDAPLDMRMGQDSELTARTVLNTYPQDRLEHVFLEYGEIRQARKLAKALVEYRERQQLVTVAGLIGAIGHLVPKQDEKQFLARLFQSLRMEVNRETASLKHFLEQTVDVLNAGGRLAVISYHSLEDRTVKNFIRTGNVGGRRTADFFGNAVSPFTVITKKAIVPDSDEIRLNSRSRSAKLRIAERKHENIEANNGNR
ncbi:MAG: 16S rRNA (cytosine(1402)-N(4))-methyltransferase RsmH [Prevotellaceae bacterium]|jgi:16S rRNA (cytosine1402-N4)-methyltransferase|nr:16S rRNA (cytosine(1402)-N(4))-methyltransferase RsmH [Prevotellaceae bacterium]